jgi:endonuclease/exonuclease/phosphatase family metal-dependent hydrolase
MKILVLAATFIALISSTAHSDILRIGAWNIQNLHHGEDHELFPWGTSRTEEDHDLLLKYRDLFGRNGRGADIIALQEIGTLAAAERIFPPSDYRIIMSSRHEDDNAPVHGGDIFTAVAIKNDSGVTVVLQDDIDELVVLDSDGNPTRAGTALLLEYEGVQFWFVSVHLKSSCSSDRNLQSSGTEDCQIFWKQSNPLADWVAERAMGDVPFFIAGDFNRRFRQLQFQGEFWTRINGGDPDNPVNLDEPFMVAHPENVTRKCPTRLGRSVEPIDWILMDARVVDWFIDGSFWERRFTRPDIEASREDDNTIGLSDHCPISIDIKVN